MRPSQPLAFLAMRLNDVRGHRGDSRRAQRRNSRIAAVIQPAILRSEVELLETRLLLTVTAPVSATVLQDRTLFFSQNAKDSITVSEAKAIAGNPLELTLSVTHGTLTLGGTAGLSIIAGSNNSPQMSVFGTPDFMNTDLIGLAYTPTPGYSGDDSLKLSAGSNAGSKNISLYINTWTNSTFASLISEQQATGGDGLDLGSEFTLLLPNGDVMVHGSGQEVDGAFVPSANWYKITPDGTGNYANGTWTQLAPMHVGRQDFSSVVLPNGDVFVLGGEYATDGQVPDLNTGTEMYSDSAEIYNPATNVWTSVPPDPHHYTGLNFSGLGYTQTISGNFAGDQPSEVLPNGNILIGNIFDNGTEIFNPNNLKNPWSNGPAKVHTNDQSAEESWVKLGNGDILTYDIWSSIADQKGEAELLNTSTMKWSDASHGILRFLSTAATDDELGPALIGVRGGDALFTGANGRTESYNPNTNSWSAGPQLPDIPTPNGMLQLTAGDAPAVVLPNGDTLMALSPAVSASGNFPGPTSFYEFDPVTGVFTDVTPPLGVSNEGGNSFNDTMLVLPSGQILMTNATSQLAFYTLAPGDGANPTWAPTITSFTKNANGSYTLTGTQLNGRDEGAAYGDDKQMAENYPLVQMVDLDTGTVYYATTSKWSSTGVATGNTPETVNVALPPGIGGNNGIEVPFLVFAIADGIPSVPIVRYFVGPGFSSQAVADGAFPHLVSGGQFFRTGALSALGANDSSFAALVPLKPSVANVTPPSASAPGPSLDSPFNSKSTTVSPVSSNPARISAALDNAESVQWAGLSAALDILSA